MAGPIVADTSWQADTVRVVGDVEILDQVTLSVAAGVRVEFAGHFALGVQGRLLAVGTAADPIFFTSTEPAAFQVDSTLTGAWNGIRFEHTPATNEVSVLEYCVIEYAKALRDTTLVGPLVLVDYSGLRVVNSTIRHNVGNYGAAVFCMHGASPRLTGCLMYDNHAFTGGAAVYALDSYPRLTGCTIAHNHDINPEPPTEATAVLSYMSKPQINSCILWENETNYFLPAQLWEVKPFYTRWSDIDGGYPGEGNFNVDPFFLESGEHPYGLQDESPCLNRGAADTTGLNLPALDLAGNSRLVAGRLDVGAYEGDPTTAVRDDPAWPGEPWADMPALLPNRPNPFNPRTTIAFTIESRQALTLSVFDAAGRRLALIASGSFAAGTHRVFWNGTDTSGRPVPSGTYLLRLQSPDAVVSRKITLVR